MSKEYMFNILRGLVVVAYLKNEEKDELLDFISELEEREEV